MFVVIMSRNLSIGLIGLLAVGWGAGCSSSQLSRIDRNRDIYEQWPIEVRQAVLDGKVEPGMTPDMVRVAWGNPTEIVTQSAGGDEIWVYKTGGDDGSVLYPGGGGMSGMGGGNGIIVGTGRGGTIVAPTVGIGIGGGGMRGGGLGGGIGGLGGGIGGAGIGGGGIGGGGMGTPIYTPPTPPDIKEVEFRNGVVHRADKT